MNSFHCKILICRLCLSSCSWLGNTNAERAHGAHIPPVTDDRTTAKWQTLCHSDMNHSLTTAALTTNGSLSSTYARITVHRVQARSVVPMHNRSKSPLQDVPLATHACAWRLGKYEREALVCFTGCRPLKLRFSALSMLYSDFDFRWGSLHCRETTYRGKFLAIGVSEQVGTGPLAKDRCGRFVHPWIETAYTNIWTSYTVTSTSYTHVFKKILFPRCCNWKCGL